MDKTYICKCCGKPYTKNLVPDAYLGDNCFDCSFWLMKIDISKEEMARRVIVGGVHFSIGDEIDGPFRGHGGRKFIIQFFDGRVIETTNLWFQGKIDDRFRERLPDNAVFLPVEEKPDMTDRIPGIPF